MRAMPAPFAPLLGFALGIAFAWWAREELARTSVSGGVGTRSLVIVILFATMVFAPINAYFLAFEADWSYAYFVDTRRIPSALQLALVLLDAASVPVGFVVAASPAKSRKLVALLTLARSSVCWQPPAAWPSRPRTRSTTVTSARDRSPAARSVTPCSGWTPCCSSGSRGPAGRCSGSGAP